MELNLTLMSYRSDSLPISAQRLINAYAEIQPQSAKKTMTVFGSPGLSDFATIGRGPIRGMIEMNGIGYCVSGSDFYSFNSTGVATQLGGGIGGRHTVSMAGDGFEIVVVNGVAGYSYLASAGTFVQILDPAFNPASTVSVCDNIFVFDWLGTNKWFISQPLDGRTYDALQFASAESNPDRVKAIRNRSGTVLVFGERTVETWDHTGAPDFPFQRFKAGTADRGIRAPLAIESEDEAIFMLGDDLVFYRMSGQGLMRISTHAIEKEWATYTATSDAFCFKVAYGGHKFIYLTFPTEGKTWGFDLASQYLWHERLSWDATGEEVKWRANCSVTIFEKTLIGDANTGRIGFIDPGVFTEFGDPIVTTMLLPPIHADGRRVFMPKFELDMQSGVGLTLGQGAPPDVMLEYSDDGGFTFESPEKWTTAGAIGKYDTRLQWDRLGSFYQRTMKISVSDPVKRVFIAARAPNSSIGTE